MKWVKWMRVFGPSHAHLRIRAIPSQLTTVQMLALDLLVEINSRLLSSFVSLLRARRKVAGLVNRTEQKIVIVIHAFHTRFWDIWTLGIGMNLLSAWKLVR